MTTRALTLVAWCVSHPAPWHYVGPRLKLHRRPFGEADALELQLFRDLAPIIAKHPGDSARIWHACPDRWRPALTIALALPDWWLARAGEIPELVADWNRYGSRGWELPTHPVGTVDPLAGVETPRLEVAA